MSGTECKVAGNTSNLLKYTADIRCYNLHQMTFLFFTSSEITDSTMICFCADVFFFTVE